MNRIRHVLTSLALLMFSTATALAVNISGIVKDAVTTEPLMEASVRLLATKDSAFVKGISTDIDGRFRLQGVNKGKYIIAVTYIGYTDYYKDIEVAGSNVRVGVIEMREASHLLGEVSIVATKTPIKVMEDTVEYNADSYHTQPNAVVEDLLKRLPGVEVDSDGKITAHGKSISKILVNGKEFFSDDPEVASKNLPADMVDKLQVVDRKSDMARLTGVDDGEDETVINLTIKKGMDNGWFGNAEMGYGTDSRYAGGFNINRFWDGNQVTFIGNLNNINRRGFGDGNGGRFRGGGGSGGELTSRSFGVNFNVGNEEIFRVGGDVMFSNTDRTSTQRQNRQYVFADYSTYSKMESLSRDRSNNVSANLRMQWKPDSFNTLEFRPEFRY
ncbi:MAG: TonB-dependent receptor, partial [Duncaniella sp.]|nr:TonB-dependent receptor [Duncaniella sp.]